MVDEEIKNARLKDFNVLEQWKLKRERAEAILNKDIDGVILVGNEVKFIKDELIKNNFNNDINIFNNESDSHEFLKNYLKKDDIILLKGSNGMKLFNTAEYLRQI